MTAVITLIETADAKATAVIEEGLNSYNRAQAGYFDVRGPGTSRIFMVKDL